jgi:hypothetical protein
MLKNKILCGKFMAIPVRWNKRNEVISVLYKGQRFRLSDLIKRYNKFAPTIV